MVSVIDEEYEIYEDCEELAPEVEAYLKYLNLGTGPEKTEIIEIIINE